MNRTVGLLFGALVLIASTVVLIGYFRGEEVDAGLVLVEAAGDIQVTGADAAARTVRPGEALQQRDTLVTGAGGHAVVSVGGEGLLDIGPSTHVQVTGVDGNNVEVELFGGRMSARVMPDSRSVRVARGPRAVAMTDAEARIAVDGDGDLFVEVDRGDAAVEGIPGASFVRKGERLSTSGGRLTELAPTPTSLLLEVRWPDGTRVRRARFRVAGRTAPSIPVRIVAGDGEQILEAGPDGHFETEVELAEGDNDVQVIATDPLGSEAREDQHIQLDSQGPSFSGDVEYRR